MEQEEMEDYDQEGTISSAEDHQYEEETNPMMLQNDYIAQNDPNNYV